MKKKEILDVIENKTDNYYRNNVKKYLEDYPKIDNFKKTILIEVICRLIEKHYTVKKCLEEMTEEYNVNCKRIVFFAILPMIKMPTIKEKILFLLNINEVICECILMLKIEIVQEIFKY